MRTLLLLLLVALPARTEDTVDLSYSRDDTVEDVLLDTAGRLGWTVLSHPDAGLQQKLGVGFHFPRIPRDRLPDTCRAVLAFWEITLADLGNGVRLAYRSPSTNGSRFGPVPPRRVRLALLGVGGATSLDFEAHANTRQPLRLLPETRDRLLLGLRFGLHPEGRARAVQLLGAIGPHFRSTADALARALDDKDAAVRLAAVRALGRCGAAATHVLPRLLVLTRADDPALRHAARVAYRRLAPLSAAAR